MKLSTLGIIVALVVGLSVGMFFAMPMASAQDATIQTVSSKVETPEKFDNRLTNIVHKNTSVVMGPFDIIVGTTDKSKAGIKYSNVPYFTIIGPLVIFPNGDKGKKNKDVLVMSTNVTIRTK